MEIRPDIVVMSHDLSGSGVVRNGVRLANLAQSRGLHTEYWVMQSKGALAQDLHRDVRVVQIAPNLPFRLPRGLCTMAFVPQLARMISKRRPRLILSAGNHFHLASSLAWHMAGRPEDVRFAGRASNAVAGPERLGAWAGLLAPVIRGLEKLKYRGMETIISVAEELAQSLAGIGIGQARIRVIANGVDIDEITAKAKVPLQHPWFENHDAPVIIGSGRLSRQKDFELLIRAFAKARQKRRMRLLILGRGAAHEKLAALAQRLGVAEDVRLEGFQPNPFAYFARADLFVLSSRWEGMSNVLLEALACGLNVVAVAAPTGTAEVLGDGAFGTLVRSRAPEALAEAMLAALDNPAQAERQKARAREYSLERSLAAYAKLLFD